MPESARKVPTLTKLGKLANAKKFETLEDVWPEAVAWREYRPADLLRIVGQVDRQGDPERADGLLVVLIDHLAETQGTDAALAAARVAARELPRSALLRDRLRTLFTAEAGDFPELPGLLDVLIAPERRLGEAVELVERYLALKPGAYVADHNFLVPGLVESVTPENGLLTVRFDDRRNEYGPETVARVQPLPADHLPALILYDPERMRELVRTDPIGFVDVALRSDRDGQVGYRQLKEHVTRLLGESGWKSWWRQARETIRRSPTIAMGGGSQPTLRLLRREDRYEDRLRRRFDREQDPVLRLRQVLDYALESGATADYEPDRELLAYLGNSAAKIAVASLEQQPELALAGLAVHARVAEKGADVARPNPSAAGRVLARIPDPSLLAQALPEPLLMATLEYLRSTLPDRWAEIWASVLDRAGKRVCDQVARALLEAGKAAELQAAVDRARAHPTASPDLIGWLWRAFHGSTTGDRLRQLSGVTPSGLLDALFELIHTSGRLANVSGDERHQKVLESAHAALLCNNGGPLRDLIEGVDRDGAQRLRTHLQSNAGLAPGVRTRLLGQIRARFPDLFVEIDRPWQDEGVIYTTESGLRQRQEQLDRIIKHEIPEVAQQIGEAASFGDLSENAEFTAALEKRDQLTSRAAGIESELKQAKVINPDDVADDYVGIGTRIHVQELASGDRETYTFLGPWDADAGRHILFYRAPLALAFMGRRVGEEVAFGEGEDARRWRVEKIEAAGLA
jgi:transcription elongation factor GreA